MTRSTVSTSSARNYFCVAASSLVWTSSSPPLISTGLFRSMREEARRCWSKAMVREASTFCRSNGNNCRLSANYLPSHDQRQFLARKSRLMNRDELAPAVLAWLEMTPGPPDAADWLLDRAETSGEIPKEPTLDVAVSWRNALESLFSARFVRLSLQGRKLTVWFDRWEREQFGESGVLLPILAEARGRPLINRRHQRQRREAQLDELIRQYINDEVLPGHVARRELSKLEIQP